MTVYEQTIAKIQILPQALVQEVEDFVDFLMLKHSEHLHESDSTVQSDETQPIWEHPGEVRRLALNRWLASLPKPVVGLPDEALSRDHIYED